MENERSWEVVPGRPSPSFRAQALAFLEVVQNKPSPMTVGKRILKKKKKNATWNLRILTLHRDMYESSNFQPVCCGKSVRHKRSAVVCQEFGAQRLKISRKTLLGSATLLRATVSYQRKRGRQAVMTDRCPKHRSEESRSDVIGSRDHREDRRGV